MAILRLKQADGTWAEVPALKGDPGPAGSDGKPGKDGADGYTPVRGTDYWTDADKAEIKGYVDEAVKDIDIPTADPYELPVATADTLGGVRVGKGLEMDGERLGVAAEKPMRLINSVTLTEGVQRVEISTDENDKTFNAQALYAKITVSEKPAALALVGSGSNPLAFVWTDRLNGAGYMWVGMFEHKAKRIFMTRGGYYSSYGSSTTADMSPYTQGMGFVESDGFGQFYFHILSGTWPAGTKFELYEMGVS